MTNKSEPTPMNIDVAPAAHAVELPQIAVGMCEKMSDCDWLK